MLPIVDIICHLFWVGSGWIGLRWLLLMPVACYNASYDPWEAAPAGFDIKGMPGLVGPSSPLLPRVPEPPPLSLSPDGLGDTRKPT